MRHEIKYNESMNIIMYIDRYKNLPLLSHFIYFLQINNVHLTGRINKHVVEYRVSKKMM